jgi:hypothetical protein
MRNLTVSEACLLVGTAVLGSAAFLGLELSRVQRHALVVSEPAASVQDVVEVALPEAVPDHRVSLPSSPPLEQPKVAAPVKKKPKAPKPRVNEPVLDAECETSDDPLCGQL